MSPPSARVSAVKSAPPAADHPQREADRVLKRECAAAAATATHEVAVARNVHDVLFAAAPEIKQRPGRERAAVAMQEPVGGHATKLSGVVRPGAGPTLFFASWLAANAPPPASDKNRAMLATTFA